MRDSFTSLQPMRTTLIALAIGALVQVTHSFVIPGVISPIEWLLQFGAAAACLIVSSARNTGLRTWLQGLVIAIACALPISWIANQFVALPGVALSSSNYWVRDGLWFGNANILGIAIASTSMLAALFLSRTRYLGFTLILLAGFVVVGLWSRGIALALGVGLVVFCITRFTRKELIYIGLTGLLLGSLFVVSLSMNSIAWSTRYSEHTLQRFVGSGTLRDTVLSPFESRLEAHASAITVIASTWPLGSGYGNYSAVLSNLYTAGVIEAEASFEHAHNQILNWLAEGGLFGTIAWGCPLIIALWGINRRGWRWLAPFAATQMILWWFEAPFFHVAAFVPMWMAIGTSRWMSSGHRGDSGVVKSSLG